MKLLLVLILCVTPLMAHDEVLRGDVDSSGAVGLTDVMALFTYLFYSGPAPECPEAADVNGDGSIALTDAVYLIQYLFAGGPPPPPELDCE